MECFVPIKLSESQRPVFLEGTHLGLSLFSRENHTPYQKGAVTLTTHRLIWISLDGNPRTAVALYHHAVNNVEPHSGGMMGFGAPPKIVLHLKNHGSNVRVGFKSGGRENFVAKYKSVLQNKAWEKEVAPVQKEFSTTSAGVGGLMRTLNKKTEDAEKTLSQAFTDINALMQKAKELVVLADKFAALQKAEGEEGGTPEEQEYRNFLVSMGIVSPVTKKNAGSLYHTELARQLSDWLITRVLPKHPMVQLTDMYCLFNRARGSELISTEDLYRACMLFDDLSLPVRMRRFESGVQIVQSANESDDAIAQEIVKKIDTKGPLTALDLSKYSEISPALALEQLHTAEKLEYLCRDETFAGLVFYVNLFRTL